MLAVHLDIGNVVLKDGWDVDLITFVRIAFILLSNILLQRPGDWGMKPRRPTGVKVQTGRGDADLWECAFGENTIHAYHVSMGSSGQLAGCVT